MRAVFENSYFTFFKLKKRVFAFFWMTCQKNRKRYQSFRIIDFSIKSLAYSVHSKTTNNYMGLYILHFIANLWYSTRRHDVTKMQYKCVLHGRIAHMYSWASRTFTVEAENSPLCDRQHGIRQANPRFTGCIISVIELNTRCATSDVNIL